MTHIHLSLQIAINTPKSRSLLPAKVRSPPDNGMCIQIWIEFKFELDLNYSRFELDLNYSGFELDLNYSRLELDLNHRRFESDLNYLTFPSSARGFDTYCQMEYRTDMKEAEGCCIEWAIRSEYIHNLKVNMWQCVIWGAIHYVPCELRCRADTYPKKSLIPLTLVTTPLLYQIILPSLSI